MRTYRTRSATDKGTAVPEHLEDRRAIIREHDLLARARRGEDWPIETNSEFRIMARKSKPAPIIETITDRDEFISAALKEFEAIWAAENNNYPGLSDYKRFIAEAIFDRDFSVLRELVMGYRSRDKEVFCVVTGVKLPKSNGSAAYNRIRKWCGLSDAWQERDDAQRAYNTEYDNLFSKYGERMASLAEEVQRLLNDGWVQRAVVEGMEILYRNNNRLEYHHIGGKDLKKDSFFKVAKPLLLAGIRLLSARATHAAEADKQQRSSITASATGLAASSPNTAMHFL